ncbi:hypothetical protein GJ496_003454 [Pomphorhynchus laevis]|nr:hypothetical protein GJ496_003454 [Pomphorhynchus laevis]
MTALFSPSQHNKVLSQNTIEFKAGKLILDGKMVTADIRKGRVKLNFNTDNLLNLTWTDRTSNKVEDDFIILPDEVEFVKVTECKTGRVFLLKWKDHHRRLFFWMQESDANKDEALFKRITDLVSNPKPSPPTVSGSHSNRDRLISSNFLENLTNLHGSNQEKFKDGKLILDGKMVTAEP